MADKPTLPPASEPFPGSRTPGWNDPPTLQYNSSGASSSRTRLNLNKRVAFPLGSGEANTSKPTAIVPPNQGALLCNMPTTSLTTPSAAATQPIAVVHPMPNMNATPPVGGRNAITSAESSGRTVGPVIALPTDAQEYSLRLLRDQIANVQESLNVRREEIERRLGLIEQLWQSGNLSAQIQEKIYRLTKAIEEKKFNEAMEIHTSLVTNHSSECSTWAVALRHIILTMQPCNEEAATTSSTIANISNVAVVPAVYVAAMPRIPMESSSTDSSTPQHI